MMNPSSYITWDQEAFYFFNYGSEDDAAQIVKISLSDGSVETIVEGEALMETEAYRINQVDEEYFYHGDHMYTEELREDIWQEVLYEENSGGKLKMAED